MRDALFSIRARTSRTRTDLYAASVISIRHCEERSKPTENLVVLETDCFVPRNDANRESVISTRHCEERSKPTENLAVLETDCFVPRNDANGSKLLRPASSQ
jgi:hypothetical protein